MGPHQMFGNFPRSIEYAVSWNSRLLKHCRDNGYRSFEATAQGVEEWTEHVHKCAEGFLSKNVDSWMPGVNKNVAHRRKRTIARYNGSAVEFRRICEDVANSGYKPLIFDESFQEQQLQAKI